jgi:putative redox protein
MSQAAIKEAVSKLAAAVQQNPENATAIYRGTTVWKGDVLCSNQIGKHNVMVDEPAVFGGGDTAPSPADLILAALGSCQEIMYSALASSMDIPLESVRIELKGNLDLRGLMGIRDGGKVHPGFLDLSYVTHLASSADEATLKKLVDAVEAQCPILDTLIRPITVTGKAILNGGSEYVAQQAA